MKKTLTFNDTVREALALALLRLMKEEPFHQISISDIVKVAGVSRSSFYRNFTSKKQLLFEYVCDLYRGSFQAGKVLHRMAGKDELQVFIMPRFGFIKQHRAIFTALNDHGMLYEFFQQTEGDLILLLCGQEVSISPYYRAMCSGACAGISRMWIENGFRETEREMAALFANLPMIPV